MRLSYAALSDVGRVRKDNQDSGYAGPHLLVIADGVGGSARGDVASSQTVEVLRRLDEPPGNDPLGSLAGTIHLAHDRIAELVAAQPELEGTSTTVTAMVFDGTRLAVGHVGDSRGYLLRAGTLSQLTTDHTFVQSLIDEGRITEDEARVHPHRNLILRAVDGVHEPEPDVFTLDVAEGDRILVCSDGASGVLPDAQLTRLLADGTPDHAAVTLVSAALDAGSSDNVTVVVADVVPDDAVVDEETSAASMTGPMLVGAAAEAARGMLPGVPVTDDTGELPSVEHDDHGTSRAGGRRGRRGEEHGDHVDPEEVRYAPRPPRRFLWLRRVAVLLVLALAVGLIGFAAYRWSQDRYFVGVSGESVVIYRGVEADIPGIQLNHVYEETDLLVEDLPDAFARRVQEGVAADTLEDARNVVSDYSGQVDCPEPTPTPSPSPLQPRATQTPDGSAGPTPEPSRSASPTPAPTESPTRVPAVCESPS
jgi:serine/threonine protein phosphatase PrpC